MKEKLKKLWADFSDAWERHKDAGNKIDQAKIQRDKTLAAIEKSKNPDRIFLLAELGIINEQLDALDGERSIQVKLFQPILDALNAAKKLLGIGRLDAIWLPIAAVGGLVVAVSKFWTKVINETRIINGRNKALTLLAEGKITDTAYKATIEDVRAKGGESIFDKIGGIIGGLALLLVLPQLLSVRKR